VAAGALCFAVSFVVGWLAGGWLPTVAVRFASGIITSAVRIRWSLFSYCGCRSLLVSCPFKGGVFFWRINQWLFIF
jgi:hypothetical protein